jgi:hypothetical protein
MLMPVDVRTGGIFPVRRVWPHPSGVSTDGQRFLINEFVQQADVDRRS